MRHLKKTLLGAAVAVIATAGLAPAHAVVITSPSSLVLENLGVGDGTGLQSTATRVTASSTTTFSGTGTGIYSGNMATTNGVNGYLSPFGSSNQNFYAVEPGGSIVITFNSAQTSFGLLFGTIDDYNSLSFTTSGVGGSQTFSGTDVLNAIGGTPGGTTRNILFSGLSSFTTVTATDSKVSAFEFVPAAVATAVPEPASMALLGLGLVGFGALRRRSAK